MNYFPLCIPQNKEQTQFKGYLTAKNREFYFELEFIDKKGNLTVCSELKRILKPLEPNLSKRLAQCTTVDSYFQELKTTLDQIIKEEPPLTSTSFYQKFIKEVDSIGWEKVIDMNNDLSKMSIQYIDESNRKHIIHIQIRIDDFLNQYPLCSCDLPIQLDIKVKPFSLQKILDQYKEKISKLQEFWDIMEDFDKNTWVLEPEKPLYSHTMRRIALGSHSSILVEIDPLKPKNIPGFQFLGADSVINPLREKLNHSLDQWSSKDTPRRNLEKIFETTFPKKNKDEMSEITMDCGICYCYKLDEKIPDKVCDNNKCGMPFHTQCLVEWLRAIPTTRQSFNTLFGTCPYCSETISIRVNK